MRQLILLVGPTCSGKSTLEKELNRRGIPSVISYTTRPQRSSEVDGEHYHFVKSPELRPDGSLIIQMTHFAGYEYGSTSTALNAAFEKSDVAVIVVEPTGVHQFQRYAESLTDELLQVISVYVHADIDTLTTRLIERFDNDTQADPKYYWERMVQMHTAHRDWPNYTNWSYEIDSVDDSNWVTSTDMVVNAMLAAVIQ